MAMMKNCVAAIGVPRRNNALASARELRETCARPSGSTCAGSVARSRGVLGDNVSGSSTKQRDSGGDGTAAFPEKFFERVDTSPDSQFYQFPRLVTHIDDATFAALTAFYAEFLPAGMRILDLMSSWVSHLPATSFQHVAGLGMNAEELAANPRLDERIVHDLNAEPRLPFADQAFDRAVVAVSIQYLTRPVEVFTDLARVLEPGGRVAIAMSHRCFPTKAILAFRALPPQERVRVVGVYLHAAGYVDVDFIDRSPPQADPLWIVTGTRGAD